MIDEAGFIAAMEKSGVSKVAVIDDVFDLPEIDQNNSGKILEFFDSPTTAAALRDAEVSKAVSARARKAIEKSEFDSDDLLTTIGALYRSYIDTLDGRFDPAGLFADAKGPNLNKLRPLLMLLKKCASIEVQYGGSGQWDSHKETHLLFVDFFLDDELGPDDIPKGKKASEARSASLSRVKQLIADQNGQTPSVILMSSKDISGRAAKFRADIGKGSVFASRFAFLHKDHVSTALDGSIAIDPDAGDALLDVVQSYEFGRALQTGLDCWLNGAKESVDHLRDEIDQMDLKDFAYLVRFRLSQEGQGLLDYLEWFFGECLVDAIGKAVDKSAKTNSQITALNDNASTQIEGAFDGPTKKIAELFHRVRIEAPRVSRRANFRLGDMYQVGPKNVVATVTPDCDLIRRPDNKRRAPQLLTVGGTLKPLDAPDGSVADFFILNGKPFNIIWDRKALATQDFGAWPEPGKSTDEAKFLGTLRPLYGQQLQRDVLHDLGRVGLSVAPAIGMTAAVEARYRKKGGKVGKIDLSKAGTSPSVVVMGRGGSDKAKVLFKRRLVRALLEELKLVKVAELDDPQILNPLLETGAYQKLGKMYRDGVTLEETIAFGIFLTARTKPGGGVNPWCWLTVSLFDDEE